MESPATGAYRRVADPPREALIRAWCLIAAATCCSVGCGDTSTTPVEDEVPEVAPEWESFAIDALQAERERRDVGFLTVLDDRPFRMGLLHAPKSTEVGLVPHGRDAVYYVVSGSGRISSDSADVDAQEGHAIFVRGDVEHEIWNVSADLDLLVIFRLTPPAPDSPALVAYAPDEMTRGGGFEEPVFNPLLTTPTLGLGMYLVPKGGGDDLMVHRTDELKIIVNGTARFEIGAGGLRASPGEIALIPDGVLHRFRKVADPLDVLVVWER